jgi:hypothetical protein
MSDEPTRLIDGYALYMLDYAPFRVTSLTLGPLADFVELLRERQIDAHYSDEEWIEFLLPFVGGDEDRARDLWDSLLCQPSYDH